MNTKTDSRLDEYSETAQSVLTIFTTITLDKHTLYTSVTRRGFLQPGWLHGPICTQNNN